MKLLRIGLVGCLLVAVLAYSIPVASQSGTNPEDLRLTAAAIRVQVAGDKAQADALEAQAKAIDRANARATAEQNKANATQTALYRPTNTPVPTATEIPTVTPVPSATSAATNTPVPASIVEVQPTAIIGPVQPTGSEISPIWYVALAIFIFGGFALMFWFTRNSGSTEEERWERRKKRMDDFQERMERIRRRK